MPRAGTMLIYSSKDAGVSAARWENLISLGLSIVILQDPSNFCTGQTDELNGNVVDITHLCFFQVCDSGINL